MSAKTTRSKFTVIITSSHLPENTLLIYTSTGRTVLNFTVFICWLSSGQTSEGADQQGTEETQQSRERTSDQGEESR